MEINLHDIGIIIGSIVAPIAGLIGLVWKGINKKFDSIDKRFEKIDQRFEKIDQRFERIDQRFERMEEKISILKGQSDEIKGELHALRHYMLLDKIDRKILKEEIISQENK